VGDEQGESKEMITLTDFNAFADSLLIWAEFSTSLTPEIIPLLLLQEVGSHFVSSKGRMVRR